MSDTYELTHPGIEFRNPVLDHSYSVPNMPGTAVEQPLENQNAFSYLSNEEIELRTNRDYRRISAIRNGSALVLASSAAFFGVQEEARFMSQTAVDIIASQVGGFSLLSTVVTEMVLEPDHLKAFYRKAKSIMNRI
jgi:hypothetical protein